jgi:ActR/RegA family two-component response regulator
MVVRTQFTRTLGLCVTDKSGRGVSAAENAAPQRRVLLCDPNAGWRDFIARQLGTLGIEPRECSSIDELRNELRNAPCDLVVLELSFPDGTWFDAFNIVQMLAPEARVVIATASGSIASTVEAMRCGVTGYLAKPVTAQLVLSAAELGAPPADPSSAGMSLDRAIWEYLTQTVSACGSIAAAARSLGLDRRSLRRMLSKNPPAR